MVLLSLNHVICFFAGLTKCIPNKLQRWKLNWDKTNTAFYFGQARWYDAPCDPKTEGGPWLVIQRRVNGQSISIDLGLSTKMALEV